MNWDPREWKRPLRLLLGLITIWPPVYVVLFVGSIFSMFLLIPFAAESRSKSGCGDIDLIQLDRKIRAGQIKQLTVHEDEILALDNGECEYRVSVTNETTRNEILALARETVNGRPRVAKVQEETARSPVSPLFPVGFVVLFAAHFLTILLMTALMPLYIILAVKDERHDQTMRIIWVVLFCTIGMFAMPVYWYLYIWRSAPGQPPANPNPV